MHHTPSALDPACSDDVLTEVVLQLVRDRAGVDFMQYRAATIQRRIRNRMLAVGVSSLRDYLQRLRHDPAEAEALAERLAIKVSTFYRNPVTFDLLRTLVFPQLADRPRATTVRVWCAGCARGQEAYTLAMLLDEAGIDGWVEATDIDPGALEAARLGVYGTSALEHLPEDLASRYLEPVADGTDQTLRVVECVRQRVRFTRHDVTAASAAGQFDVVSCRNVLIYLQRPAQERAMQRLCAALGPGAVLVLGEAEWPTRETEGTFEVLGRAARVFKAKTLSQGLVA